MIFAAAYCRVSTDKEDQSNSFLSQKLYFEHYIAQQDGWVLSEIYADEGISGTSTRNRTQFNRMMEDARAGCYSILLTKEVSRFARNTLDAISFTRELNALGVCVIFLTDGINMQDADAELRLAILGSLAQEESRRTSQRVKWGQTRRMEQGVVFGHSLIGYRLEGGILSIEPKGAALVSRIFTAYTIEKQSTRAIAAAMEAETGDPWSATKILRILRNEKYAGDLIQKKTFTPNYLTHEKKANRGQEAIISIPDHHEAIIPRELWEHTQKELNRRSRNSGEGCGKSSQLAFSGKIYCSVCGSVFVAKSKRRNDGSLCRRWCCSRSAQCGIGKTVRDSLLRETVADIINNILVDPEAIAKDITAIITQAGKILQLKVTEDAEKMRARAAQKLRNALELYCEDRISRQMLNDLCKKLDTPTTETISADIQKDNIAFSHRCQDVLSGRSESTIFYQTIIQKITIYPDHIDFHLLDNDHIWRYDFTK